MSYFKGKPKRESVGLEQIKALPLAADVLSSDSHMKRRKIRPETLRHFGIRAEFSEVDGTVVAHYFPVTKGGELVGYIKRDLRKPKKDSWYTIGAVDVTCDLLGQAQATHSKYLWITEGCYDYLSAWQALYFSEYNQKRKEPYSPSVVSIALGTKNAAEQIANQIDFIKGYGDIILCFDSDKATPEEAQKGVIKGQDAVAKVAKVVPDLKNVVLPRKDPNEMLQHDEQEQLYKALLFEHKEYQPEYITTGGIGLDALTTPLAKGVSIKCLPETSRILHGLRPREMTIMLAPTGVGKCLGKGTKVRMYDGTLKKVEEITTGDMLMGIDGEPRVVTSTTKGIGKLYRVNQSKGMSYVVNDAHILSLRAAFSDGAVKRGDILNENVEKYMQSTKNHRRLFKGWRITNEPETSAPCVVLSTLEIEEYGIGEYYGFTLEGRDRLFLLEDGTVTHNTTVCKEIGYELVKSGAKVGHIFLEEDQVKTQQTYLALDNNVPLPRFREDPSIVPRERLEKSYKELIDNGRTLWMHHGGKLDPAKVMHHLEWMTVKGVEYVILDHISMVFSGHQTSNERKDIDLLLTEMAAWVTESGVHAIVVSHIKRTNRPAPKDKDGTVKYPYWQEVCLDDARGSGSFEQLAWNIIAIEPERLEDGARGRIRTRVLKNREWGWLGLGDVLEMHPQTGRLQTCETYLDQEEDE